VKLGTVGSFAGNNTHKATTTELKELWAQVADERVESTGDEARAIREANAVVARQAERSLWGHAGRSD
jgi:hypothetical protein